MNLCGYSIKRFKKRYREPHILAKTGEYVARSDWHVP